MRVTYDEWRADARDGLLSQGFNGESRSTMVISSALEDAW